MDYKKVDCLSVITEERDKAREEAVKLLQEKMALVAEVSKMNSEIQSILEAATDRENEILSILLPPDGRMTAIEASRFIRARLDVLEKHNH
jgi:hypothetical protein